MMGGITVFIHPTENGPDEYKNESATKVKNVTCCVRERRRRRRGASRRSRTLR